MFELAEFNCFTFEVHCSWVALRCHVRKSGYVRRTSNHLRELSKDLDSCSDILKWFLVCFGGLESTSVSSDVSV